MSEMIERYDASREGQELWGSFPWLVPRIWSLRDMLKIDGPRFLNGVFEIAAFKQLLLAHFSHKGERHNLALGISGVDDITKASKYLLEVCNSLRWSAPTKQLSFLEDFLMKAERIMEGTASEPAVFLPYSNLRGLAQTADRIVMLLDAELDRHVFLALDPSNLIYWEEKALLDLKTSGSFPEAAKEIPEASKCLALERYTSSVFHSMRALEDGISHICQKLKLVPRNPNWENILNDLASEINNMGPTTHGHDWKDEKKKYSGAVAHLRLCQRAWRNHVMHLYDRFDHQEAVGIFDGVKSFLRDLAG